MSKIRTLDQLNDKLSEEIAWRKKELIYLKTVIAKEKDKSTQPVLLRSGITILYAHWEGCIKNSATSYIEFVARQNLNYADLSSNFLALVIQQQFMNNPSLSELAKCSNVAELVKYNLNTQSFIQWKETIKTKSNLNSSVLKEIINILGLDYSFYLTKEKIIDETLLRTRNEIAHGERSLISFERYSELHYEIINLMDLFKNQIENAACSKAYIGY